MVGTIHFEHGATTVGLWRSAASRELRFNGGAPSACRSALRESVIRRRGQYLSSARNVQHVPPGSLFWNASPKCRRGRRVLCPMAGVNFDLSPATIVLLSSALSFGLLRAFVYFRMEYITAAMLGRHVPRGGAKVVELDIREGRNLYYYPADIEQVVAVSSNPNRVLLENQAVKAGVPIQIKTRGASSLGLPPNSMDAVISVNCFHDIPDEEVVNVLREAIRVLKPGKPFIFVEPIGAKNSLVRAAQGTLETLSKLSGSKRSITRDLLQYIQGLEGLEGLEFDEVFGLLDPQLVGVAKKVDVKSEAEKSSTSKRGFKK